MFLDKLDITQYSWSKLRSTIKKNLHLKRKKYFFFIFFNIVHNSIEFYTKTPLGHEREHLKKRHISITKASGRLYPPLLVDSCSVFHICISFIFILNRPAFYKNLVFVEDRGSRYFCKLCKFCLPTLGIQNFVFR